MKNNWKLNTTDVSGNKTADCESFRMNHKKKFNAIEYVSTIEHLAKETESYLKVIERAAFEYTKEVTHIRKTHITHIKP